ncbi:MAG: hypothetical protein OXG35_13600 [Acidobacteria bacterium]|nr:hypothetical protein [Acidobacteriota bacterium]
MGVPNCRFEGCGRGGLFKGKERSDVEAYLNDLGNEGWELVNLDFRELDNRFECTGVAKRERDA